MTWGEFSNCDRLMPVWPYCLKQMSYQTWSAIKYGNKFLPEKKEWASRQCSLILKRTIFFPSFSASSFVFAYSLLIFVRRCISTLKIWCDLSLNNQNIVLSVGQCSSMSQDQWQQHTWLTAEGRCKRHTTIVWQWSFFVWKQRWWSGRYPDLTVSKSKSDVWVFLHTQP